MPLIRREGHEGELFPITHRKTGQHATLSWQKDITVNSRETAIALAQKGLGFALVTRLSVVDKIKAGQLYEILPDFNFGTIRVDFKFRDTYPSLQARALHRCL